MKQPLLYPAIAITAGVLVGNWLEPPVHLLLAFSISVGLWAVLHKEYQRFLILFFIFLLGWTNYAIHTAINSQYDLRVLIGDKPALAHIRGTVISPVNQITKEDDQYSIANFNVKVESLSLIRNSSFMQASGNIRVRLYEAPPTELYQGQKLELFGILKIPPQAQISKMFDYQAILKRQEIYYIMDVVSSNDIKIITPKKITLPLTERFRRWAKGTLSYGLPVNDESIELRQAMLLGFKTGLTEDVKDHFMRSGTMHLFAVSGIHVGLLSGAILVLLRTFLVPRQISAILLLISVWFFTSLTGWQASAVRATIMISVIMCGWIINRPSNLLNSLFCAAIIILLWDPQQLFRAGFQLSFMVVLSLAVFMPGFEKILNNLIHHDPFILPELIPEWKRFLYASSKIILVGFFTSFTSLIGSTPLVAYHFNLVTIVSLLANIIIVPLGSLVLICNVASIFAFWCKPALELFNFAGSFWTDCMLYLCKWFSSIPNGWWYVKQPRSLEIFTFYLIAAILASLLFENKKLFKPLLFGITLCAGLIFYDKLISRTAELTVISFERSHIVYIENTPNNVALIDCGSSENVERTLKPFLRTRGVNTLDHLFLTHGDAKHTGGVTNLINYYNVKKIYIPVNNFRSKQFKDATELLKEKPGWLVYVKRGNIIGNFNILHPDINDKFSAADNGALVLKCSINRKTVLLLSDLGRLGRQSLFSRELNLKSDILITPANTEMILETDFLSTINPKLIIFVETTHQTNNLAFTRAVSELKKKQIQVEYVPDNRGLTLLINQKNWQIK